MMVEKNNKINSWIAIMVDERKIMIVLEKTVKQ